MGNKPKLIIIDGSCGVGKSTVCNHLREQMTSTNLLSLSGVADKTITGSTKSEIYHHQVLDMIRNTSKCSLNYILCRSFMSEKVYCNLGIKPYSFQREYDVLVESLQNLTIHYDVYFFVLVADSVAYEERLKRNKGEYVKFSVDNSLRQQEQYVAELVKLRESAPSVECRFVSTMNRTSEETAQSIMDFIYG